MFGWVDVVAINGLGGNMNSYMQDFKNAGKRDTDTYEYFLHLWIYLDISNLDYFLMGEPL